jgi:hypothetical protein
MRTKNKGIVMSSRRHIVILLAVFTAVFLIMGACGAEADLEPTTAEVPTIDDPKGLPLADAGADVPIAVGLCAPGEPECVDTIVTDLDVQDLPDASDRSAPKQDEVDATVSSGMAVEGGLSISEALSSEATGVIAVRGHLFDDGNGLRFCEGLVGLGERYGCDGEVMAINGFDPTQVPEVVFFEGTTYTEVEITLFGEIVDGAFAVNDLVTG